MSERPDKRRRKELLAAVKAKKRVEARAKFPASDQLIREFFGMLDRELPRAGCDGTLRLSNRWLNEKGIPTEPFLNWLRENGGHCDCEALANAEERYEEANHDADW